MLKRKEMKDSKKEKLDDLSMREQDRYLPIANVNRIMKRALPENAKIAKDAKECVQECVSEFISFITSEASEKCITDKRKTINGEDILNAQQALGFDNYYSALKIYLVKYRENCKAERDNSTFANKEKKDVQHRTVGQIPRTIEPAVGAPQKLDEAEYIIY